MSTSITGILLGILATTWKGQDGETGIDTCQKITNPVLIVWNQGQNDMRNIYQVIDSVIQ